MTMATETLLSRSAIFSARPVLRIAGQADERASELLTAMVMDEVEGGLSALELRFTNWVADGAGHAEPAFGPGSPLRLGAELQVGSGDESAPVEIFRGRVSALEMVCEYGQPPELVVLAEDALVGALRARRSKVYADMAPADVVRAVAGELGLTPVLSGLSSPVGTWAQLDETDLAFLRRLLERFDADLAIVGTELQVAPVGEAARGSIELQLNSQLARVRITADLSQQVTAVTVAGWNAADGAAVNGQASSLTHGGPGSGRSGPQWADEAFGARSEHLRQPAVALASEATAVAQAAFDRRARGFVRAQGTAEGNPRLRVGASVALSGIGAPYDNTYRVVQASHRFCLRKGYRTEFSAECAYLGS